MALACALDALKATERLAFDGVIDVIDGAVGGCPTRTEVVLIDANVRLLIALVARSAIDPPFRSRVVLTAMPSLSYSPGSLPTVYRKVAVLESLKDRKVAYSVTEEPEPFNVKVSLGLPLTVTDSEKLTVKLSAPAGMYVALAGGETDEMVGAV